jgi:hypothetical protein
MSHLERGRVWEDYLERVNKTIKSLESLNQACEDTIKSMWLINSGIFETLKVRWGKKVLPNHQIFVSIYFKRNIAYLQSSHVLASIGFIDPSSNLNRTIYETILRGYLFIVEPNEANEYFQAIGTKEEESYFFNKGMKYVREKLYEPKARQIHRNLYKILCTSAHAGIKGANLDYPKYSANRIQDNLKMILSLTYANIQMMAECFIDYLDSTKTLTRMSMETIASVLGSVPQFEPNQVVYRTKIQLKDGNFLNIL